MTQKEILLQEIEKLPEQLAEEVLLFVEFLKAKQQSVFERTGKEYIEKLQKISVWSEEDLQKIEEAGKEFDKWQIPQ